MIAQRSSYRISFDLVSEMDGSKISFDLVSEMDGSKIGDSSEACETVIVVATDFDNAVAIGRRIASNLRHGKVHKKLQIRDVKLIEDRVFVEIPS